MYPQYILQVYIHFMDIFQVVFYKHRFVQVIFL